MLVALGFASSDTLARADGDAATLAQAVALLHAVLHAVALPCALGLEVREGMEGLAAALAVAQGLRRPLAL